MGVSFRTEINWYPSKNLTENDESFFNFFDTITYHINRVYFDEEAVSWDSFMVTIASLFNFDNDDVKLAFLISLMDAMFRMNSKESYRWIM